MKKGAIGSFFCLYALAGFNAQAAQVCLPYQPSHRHHRVQAFSQ